MIIMTGENQKCSEYSYVCIMYVYIDVIIIMLNLHIHSYAGLPHVVGWGWHKTQHSNVCGYVRRVY